ncbi:uncharacterized protein [Littorina saxatilis]|uniref:uncharacterized protein n=1 Tax=Littorina saxatilis TaxID=31220 RepID=UPI0038B42EFC
MPVTKEPPPISPVVSALIGVVGFLVLVIISLLVFIAVNAKKKSQDTGVIIRTGGADTRGGGRQDRGSGSHSYEEIPEIPRPRRFHHHRQRQIPLPRGSPALPPTPAVDTMPDDYLHPVNSPPSSSGTNQSAGASAAPAGPYDSLEMSDVGLRSAYSQLGM